MSLLSEYPYICNICKCLASFHNYRKLIKILKCVIDRHIKRILTMSRQELNIFIQILLELIHILHSESTIPLDQTFEESVIYNYIQITQLILQHANLTPLISTPLKIKLSLQIISIYFDYSRFKNIQTMIDSSIHLASITPHSHFELIKLILIKCNMISFITIESHTPNAPQLMHNMHNLITQTLNKQILPQTCQLFLRLIQITLHLRYDESIKAGQLLIETNNDLFNLIENHKNTIENKENHRIGEKRKFSIVETDVNVIHQQPRKRQKLNNSRANNTYDSKYIMNGDICLLINFCALMNLLWIARNASFEYNKSSQLGELQENIRFLMQKNEVDIAAQEMSFFETKLIEFFQQKMEKTSTMTQVHELANKINGEYFNEKIIKLLMRVDPNYNKVDNVNFKSGLLSHINWLNIHGLSSIIRQLFKCLEAMHCGKMNEARKFIKNIILVMNSNANNKIINNHDFAGLNLRFLIWNIDVHLLLGNEEKLNENMIEIGCMMKYNDRIKYMLNQEYCGQKLFENECISQKKSKKNKNNMLQKSVMFLNEVEQPLILFDLGENDMKLPSLALKKLKENESNYFFMQNLINDIENGELLSMTEVKSFLRMTAIKLHYLSSYVALIFRDRKCTRNQVKRVHRLTIKHVDVSSRFYIRLMLEILKENDVKIKTIYSYIKLIFTQNKNTLNVLPFVALCAVYAYCTIEDNVMQEFEKEKMKNNFNANNNRIKRRISFLKFMIYQLVREPIQAVYLHIISSFLVYLYKLMEKCEDYKFEMQNIKKLLEKWLPEQSEFIDLHFRNCVDIQRINDCCMNIHQNINIPSENDYNTNVDQQLKKVIINYYDHIYMRQSSSKN